MHFRGNQHKVLGQTRVEVEEVWAAQVIAAADLSPTGPVKAEAAAPGLAYSLHCAAGVFVLVVSQGALRYR